jgi:hypothetical protein
MTELPLQEVDYLDIEDRFHRLSSVRWSEFDRFMKSGVPARSLVYPELPARARVVLFPDRPLFDFAEDVGEDGAAPAFVFLARSEFREVCDLVAWVPDEARAADWLGRASMLGLESLWAPRIVYDGALVVHETPREMDSIRTARRRRCRASTRCALASRGRAPLRLDRTAWFLPAKPTRLKVPAHRGSESVAPEGRVNDVVSLKTIARDRSRARAAAKNRPSRPPWLCGALTDERDRILPIHANLMLALRSAPEIAEAFKFDEMMCAPILFGGLPVAPGGERASSGLLPRPVTDGDVSQLQEWLQHAGLPKIGRETTHQAVDERAQERFFHPIRDYLGALAWDGTPRVERWVAY